MTAEAAREMPKAYAPREHEDRLYQFWEERGYFRARPDPQRDPFCIIMPPPNVTGGLHLGHALTATLEDCLVRWHRMRGDSSLWLPGVDHAGIATQNVVERELAKEGLTRHDLGREKFVERVWEWARTYRGVITQQHRRLGASADWEREVFTLDPGPQRAVRTTFVNLYHDGLIYRGERIINWCPRCHTALSDLEVEHEEEDGNLWYVRYPLLDAAGDPDGEHIVIATTRPETIVADVAIAVNPAVKRWSELIGRKALAPVIGREIPIIADDAVDPKFGTGALKITPGHDPLDFEIGERHGLRAIIAIGPDGRMTAAAGPYEGMDRGECEKAIVGDMEARGLLEKVTPHRHSVGHCQRCGTVLEPLASKQWFVRADALAAPAIEAVKDGRIHIVPRRFTRVYLHWMENIRDWCISRQLWWGHRIPVWYCESCDTQVAPSREEPARDPAVCPACGGKDLRQDEDVLDTWFSSALWPHSTLGWPDDTEDLRYFHPATVMETGYDILFFWVARMIMLGLYNTGEIPFRHVYLHGLIRDAQGQKMSKSKGNVVDPLEAIDRYGCDALRFAIATGAAPGNDFRISDERLESGRNFANKVWNASRFVISNLQQHSTSPPPLPLPWQGRNEREGLPVEDRWILSRLNRVTADAERQLNGFQLGEAAKRLYEFFWSEYCDWYLEMAKVRLRAGDTSALAVLAYVLDASLRLLHPFVPYVTEAVWQNLRPHLAWAEAEALIVAPWPRAERRWQDPEAEAQISMMLEVVRTIRNIRAEKEVEASRWVESYLALEGDGDYLAGAVEIMETLARSRPLHIVPDKRDLPKSGVVTAVLSGGQLALPLAGLVDLDAERERLRKQLAEAEQERLRLDGKLANAEFRAKAPAEVVAKEEERLAAARTRLEGLRQRLAELG